MSFCNCAPGASLISKVALDSPSCRIEPCYYNGTSTNKTMVQSFQVTCSNGVSAPCYYDLIGCC